MTKKRGWSQKELDYIERVAGKVPSAVMAKTLQKPIAKLRSYAGQIGLSLRVPESVLERHWPEYSRKGRAGNEAV